MKDLKKKYLPQLKEIYILYTKYSGKIPINIFKENIENFNLKTSELKEIIDICLDDKMISYNFDEIFSKDEKDLFISEVSENQIIDDIEIESLIEDENIQSKYKKRRLTIEDEESLFSYINEKVKGNELEYFSIPEIVNLLLNSLHYAKTDETRVFIRMLIDTLEENININ